MKFMNKLVRNGNSTAVTIPLRALEWLQWNAGQPVVVEILQDRSVLVRTPTPSDLGVRAANGCTVGLLPEPAAR
jgi:antitoxin component of MazEF toxin-antitoxin module